MNLTNWFFLFGVAAIVFGYAGSRLSPAVAKKKTLVRHRRHRSPDTCSWSTLRARICRWDHGGSEVDLGPPRLLLRGLTN